MASPKLEQKMLEKKCYDSKSEIIPASHVPLPGTR